MNAKIARVPDKPYVTSVFSPSCNRQFPSDRMTFIVCESEAPELIRTGAFEFIEFTPDEVDTPGMLSGKP